MSSLLNVFGSGVTCVSEDDSQWLAEVHSRKSGADYKLAAASFKVCCRGREYIVCSWQIPEPFWQSLRYSVPNPSIAVIFFFAWDKWACYADISRSACMSRDSVSVRKMLTGFYAFIFQGSHSSIQELLKNNLWIDSFYLHLDWSEVNGNGGCVKTPWMTGKQHQELWWGCLLKCCLNSLETLKPSSISNLCHQSRNISREGLLICLSHLK